MIFFFLEIVIQQQGREVFIECNLFMVMAWEKGTGAKLFCTAMLKSERSRSKVLITEMTRDAIERGKKKIENYFFFLHE